MLWGSIHIELLINLYRQNPCLYAVKNPMYHNKHARNAALAEIRRELNSKGLDVTIQDIKCKFNNLRTNFLAQHKKYVGYIKSGMDRSEILKPNLWYYDHLQFLLEHTVLRKSIDNLTVKTEPCTSMAEESEEYQIEIDQTTDSENDNLSEGEESTTKVYDTSPDLDQGGPLKKQKTIVTNEHDPLITNVNKIKNSPAVEPTTPKKNINDIFGEFVARNLDFFEKEDMEIYINAQEEISGVIWKTRRQLLKCSKK